MCVLEGEEFYMVAKATFKGLWRPRLFRVKLQTPVIVRRQSCNYAIELWKFRPGEPPQRGKGTPIERRFFYARTKAEAQRRFERQDAHL